MWRFGSLTVAALACLGVACGRGVSSNPLTLAKGGGPASGSSGSNGAVAGTATSGGTAGTGGTVDRRPNGDHCAKDDDCVSGHCTDDVCCNEACGDVCESCSGEGICALDEEDRSCDYECTDRGVCRQLDNGEMCDENADCASTRCEPARGGEMLCCDRSCHGLCKACGSNGTCNDHPATDDNCGPVICEADTRCVTYALPTLNACSEHGRCAACEPSFTPARVPCGVGSQCDGHGACLVTGLGRFAAGERHTCAIASNGNVVCWGDNSAGQLGAVFGRPKVGFDEVPANVPGLAIDFGHEVWQITAGARHTCVLFDYGGVRCWGAVTGAPAEDPRIVLGTRSVAYTEDFRYVVPADTGDVILPDPDDDPAVQISAASDGYTTCALLSSGKVSCWGDNQSGQLGTGDADPLSLGPETLRNVALGERAIEVRSGFEHTCVLTESGRVQCWGKAAAGQLGYGSTGQLFSPKTGDDAYVNIGGLAIGLALGHDHTCALLDGGTVRCWGENDLGQLGYGHTGRVGDDETPAGAVDLTEPLTGRPLGGDVDFGGVAMKQIVTLAPSRSTCALSTEGKVWCWGQNDFGALGYGHEFDGATQYTPEELREMEIGGEVFLSGNALALAEGGRCAVRANDGELYCWGLNEHGQLGLGLPEEGYDVSTRYRPGDTLPVHWWAQ